MPPRVLLTTAEVARELGVSPRRVTQLHALRSDFPEPFAIAGGANPIRLWEPADIAAWSRDADRSTGRPPRKPST